LVALALLLAAVTGGVDAVGSLALDGVFSANVTGNVVMPAVGGAGVRRVPVTAAEVPVTAVAGALLGFAGSVPKRRPYPSDLSDVRWELIEPVLVAWRLERRRRALDFGRPPEHGLRDIMDAILYVDVPGFSGATFPMTSRTGTRSTAASPGGSRKACSPSSTTKRWVVERTYGRLMLYRRLACDYEIRPARSEVVLHIAMADLMARRLTSENTISWRDPIGLQLFGDLMGCQTFRVTHAG
jgi:transposase